MAKKLQVAVAALRKVASHTVSAKETGRGRERERERETHTHTHTQRVRWCWQNSFIVTLPRTLYKVLLLLLAQILMHCD